MVAVPGLPMPQKIATVCEPGATLRATQVNERVSQQNGGKRNSTWFTSGSHGDPSNSHLTNTMGVVVWPDFLAAAPLAAKVITSKLASFTSKVSEVPGIAAKAPDGSE